MLRELRDNDLALTTTPRPSVSSFSHAHEPTGAMAISSSRPWTSDHNHPSAISERCLFSLARMASVGELQCAQMSSQISREKVIGVADMFDRRRKMKDEQRRENSRY